MTTTKITDRPATRVIGGGAARYDVQTSFGSYSVYLDEVPTWARAVVLADTRGITFHTRDSVLTVTDARRVAERLAARADVSEVIVMHLPEVA